MVTSYIFNSWGLLLLEEKSNLNKSRSTPNSEKPSTLTCVYTVLVTEAFVTSQECPRLAALVTADRSIDFGTELI